ncbi:MAG: metal-dependent transcriptional regulator [Eubacteriaceae bacterium]
MEKKLTESIEDYIETIYLEFERKQKGVRITDLASLMGVSKASANDAVKKLKSLNFVEHEHYGQIYLTNAGRETAKKIYERHQYLCFFLEHILNVSSKNAELDACAIEHVLSDEAFEKIKEAVDTYKNKENKG